MIQADAMHLPLKTGSVDCIITSPPYFGCADYGGETIFRDGPSVLGTEHHSQLYAIHMAQALEESYRVLKQGGIMWLILGDIDDRIPIRMAPQRVAIQLQNQGWVIAQEIHWLKTHRVSGSVRCFGHPESTTEKVYMLAKGDMHKYSEDPFFKGNVWEISPATWKDDWAVLPEKLVEKCLFSSTAPLDIVLDPFAGSGVVPRIADYWDRVGIGCDLLISG